LRLHGRPDIYASGRWTCFQMHFSSAWMQMVPSRLFNSPRWRSKTKGTCPGAPFFLAGPCAPKLHNPEKQSSISPTGPVSRFYFVQTFTMPARYEWPKTLSWRQKRGPIITLNGKQEGPLVAMPCRLRLAELKIHFTGWSKLVVVFSNLNLNFFLTWLEPQL
jgi:hypothetical protein